MKVSNIKLLVKIQKEKDLKEAKVMYKGFNKEALLSHKEYREKVAPAETRKRFKEARDRYENGGYLTDLGFIHHKEHEMYLDLENHRKQAYLIGLLLEEIETQEQEQLEEEVTPFVTNDDWDWERDGFPF